MTKDASLWILWPAWAVLLVIGGLLLTSPRLVKEGLGRSRQVSSVELPDPLPASNAGPLPAEALYWRLTGSAETQAHVDRIGDELRIRMLTPALHGSYVQCLRHGIAFRPGATYTLHFRARTNQPRRILAGIQWQPADPDPGATNATESMEWIGIEWRTYHLTFTARRDYGTAALTIGRLPGDTEFADLAIEAGAPDALRLTGWLLQDHSLLASLILLCMIGPVYCLRRGFETYERRAVLLGLAVCLAAVNYLAWRLQTLNGTEPWIALPLFGAELLILFHTLGLQYTLWPRPEPPLTATEDIASCPIYVLIPTVNEGEEVLTPTVRGALAMREHYLAAYPDADVTICLCNDGRVAGVADWRQVERLAERFGVRCITRETPGGAKAGNIEYARQYLGATGKALIVLFDADHAPLPDFLLHTVPLFADPTLGWVQTPQYYRNLENPVARWANEQQAFFYGAICRGKSPLNAACICGTNVVIRAATLDEIGGLPQDSVTEDAAASLRLHGKWRSVYLNERLAAGLGPVDFAGYFSQQRRWATGTIELLLRGGILSRRVVLSPAQRVQYALACSHYLCGLRDLICFIAPVIFLLTGRHAPAFGTDVAGFMGRFAPYLLLSLAAVWNATRRQGDEHFPWRAAMLSHGAFPVYLSSFGNVLLKHRVGFVVTPKRLSTNRRSGISLLLPQIVVFLLGAAALARGAWTLHDSPLLLERFPIVLSSIWVGYNLFLLGGFFLLCWQAERAVARAGRMAYADGSFAVVGSDEIKLQEVSTVCAGD